MYRCLKSRIALFLSNLISLLRVITPLSFGKSVTILQCLISFHRETAPLNSNLASKIAYNHSFFSVNLVKTIKNVEKSTKNLIKGDKIEVPLNVGNHFTFVYCTQHNYKGITSHLSFILFVLLFIYVCIFYTIFLIIIINFSYFLIVVLFLWVIW